MRLEIRIAGWHKGTSEINMQLFYTPDISGDNYTLNEEESKHAVRVLRLQTGDEVSLIDGKGGWYTAIVMDPNPKRCLLKISARREEGKLDYTIHIAIAPTKNIERIEWFLEKATELGIDEISPVICQRSERKEVKTERLDKIIVSAMKQSLKAYKPIINESISLQAFLNKPIEGTALIAHCMEGTKQSIQMNLADSTKKYTVLIGPEGDFSQEELTLALSKGYKPITLGNARLRTETAALAAVFELNFLNRHDQ